MKLILSSSDFGNARSAQAIYYFLEKPIEQCTVLFFPNEKATHEKVMSGKYHERLMGYGFTRENITVADYTETSTFMGKRPDAILISGGNTFGTLKCLRSCGADREIIRMVQSGAVYIGGSAGAHIASQNIAHVARYDIDTFGLDDFSGLGLFDGVLICHCDEKRRKDAEILQKEKKYHVYTLTDNDYITVG